MWLRAPGTCDIWPALSFNPGKHHIGLDTELVKKPKDLLEYVVAHELAHLLEPTDSEAFLVVLDALWPQWRESGAELNALPFGSESWQE